jgi:hypothetical protein
LFVHGKNFKDKKRPFSEQKFSRLDRLDAAVADLCTGLSVPHSAKLIVIVLWNEEARDQVERLNSLLFFSISAKGAENFGEIAVSQITQWNSWSRLLKSNFIACFLRTESKSKGD